MDYADKDKYNIVVIDCAYFSFIYLGLVVLLYESCIVKFDDHLLRKRGI